MADDFHDPILDEILEGFAFPSVASISSASVFSASPFHPLGPFSPSAGLGFDHFCPRRLGGTHPFLDLASASPLSSSNPPPRFGISQPVLWPPHRPTFIPWAPRHSHHPSGNTPVQQPDLPTLPTFRNLASAGPSSASRASPSQASRGLADFLGRERETPAPREPYSDDYWLNELATGNFSSPSMLNGNPREPNTSATTARESSPWPTATGSSNNRSGSSQASGNIKGEPSLEDQASTSFPLVGDDFDMPTTRRSSGGASGTARRGGRKPAAPAESSQATRKRKFEDIKTDEDDPFAEDKLPVIDLSTTEEVPASLQEPEKPKNDTKIAKFQCVICMDDTSTLTATHCGHLFCGECLHSSLHIDASKKICPICRQKVEPRPPNGKFGAKAKGYYPLQLRITTKKSLGKRAAQ